MNAQNKFCYEFGSFRLNPAEHLLFHDGEVVSLTPKAFDTLLVLVENHGHLVEKDELLEQVWEGSFVEEANVAKHISILRKVLSRNGLEEPFIETIPTRGYRFVAPLTKTKIDADQEIVLELETLHEVKDFARSNASSTSTKRKRIKTSVFLVGIVAVAAVLAFGGWYYLPSMFEGDQLAVETTQVPLSTGFEKVGVGAISPDGKLVVFKRLRQGEQQTLAVRRLATGETIDLLSNLNQDWATFSPDSKFIYYILYKKDVEGLYRIPVTGGPGEKLIAGIYSRLAFSRDGNQLTFTAYKEGQSGGTVIVSDKNGENQKEISTIKRPNYVSQSIFSNDGRRVLIWEGDHGRRHSGRWVNIDDKTETEAKELAPLFEQNWDYIRNLVLLKDGSGLLFSGKKTVISEHVFHLSLISGKITQITANTAPSIHRFSVSDDGKTIAVNEGGMFSNMISYDPVTKESRQIMNENKAFVPWWGGFSQMPDGRILYSNSNGHGSDIYSMDKDGGNETRITSDSGINVNPVATPDGKYIVFKSTRSDAANLWRMDADGSNPVRLTNYVRTEMDGITEFELWNRSIQIANNGKTVFFAQQPNPGEKSKLMKISINGGEALELLPNSQTSNIRPYISPDGKNLAFIGFVYDSKTSENKFTTYIHSLEGDRVGELKKAFDGRIRPHWAPDGKALSYIKETKQLNNIWKRDIETGKETALTEFKSEADQVMMFDWANDGKKILIVRVVWPRGQGMALIRNRDISKKLF